MKKNLIFYIFTVTLFFQFELVNAELIVLQARGGGLKVGQSVAATKTIILKEDRHMSLI